MAIIIENSSTCGLCGKILSSNDELIGLPPISNADSPLYEYFDRGYHKSCFESWDKRQEIDLILQVEKQQFGATDYYKEMESKFGKPGSKNKD